jgi:hypothetical protein
MSEATSDPQVEANKATVPADATATYELRASGSSQVRRYSNRKASIGFTVEAR